MVMPGWIDSKVNVVQIGAFVLGAVIGSQHIFAKLDTLDRAITELTVNCMRRDVSERQDSVVNARLDDLRNRMGRLESKFDLLK